MAKNNYFTNVENYMVSYLHAKRMHEMGIITSDDLNKIDIKLREKYSIKINSLYVAIDWINTPFRVNM